MFPIVPSLRLTISGSANVKAGGTDVGAGGAANVIVDNAQARVNVGKDVSVEFTGKFSARTDVSDHMISGTASLSAGTVGGAGVANVILSRSVSDVAMGAGSMVKAREDVTRAAQAT